MNKKLVLNFNKKMGFTLVELLVTISIIGLLSTLAMAGVNMAREKARIAKAKSDIDELYKAVSMLATDSGEWPDHWTYNTVCITAPCPALCGLDTNNAGCADGSLGDGIGGVMSNDTVTPYSNWAGPYMQKMPTDPWGHEYFFSSGYPVDADGLPCTGVCLPSVVIGSYGPDGLNSTDLTAASGSDVADDIIKILAK